MTYGVKFIV